LAKQNSELKRRNPARFPVSSSGFSKRLTALVSALIAGLMLSACGGSNNNRITQDDLGSIRALNAVSDSPTLDVLLEGSTAANLRFGQISGFQQTVEDDFDLAVFRTELDGAVTTLLEEFRTEVREQEQTTVVVAGSSAAPIAFDFFAPNPDIAIGSAEYHVLNTSGAGTVDVFLTTPGAALDSPVASVANNAVSELISAEAGTRQLRITSSGSSEVLYDSGQFELTSGNRSLFHIQPYFGPGDPTLRVTTIEGTRTTGFADEQLPVSVRVANAIADVPGADAAVNVNGATIDFTNVASNAFSATALLDSGAAELRVNMQTDPGTIYYSDTQQLVAGDARTLLVAGNFGNNTTTGRLVREPQRPISTFAQVHIMQGTISADRVDVYFLNDGATTDSSVPDVINLALLANVTEDIAAGTYDVVVTATGNNTVLAGPETITLTNETIRTILITDADGGGTPPRIIIEDQS